MELLDDILSAHDTVAVLGREVAVQLIDISNSGCLLHSTFSVPEGTTGTLRLSYDGVDYADDVRIMRCQTPNGGDQWFRLGAQFLWTTPPGERSLRRVIAGIQPAAFQGVRFAADRPM